MARRKRKHLEYAVELRFAELNPPTANASLWWAVAACQVLRQRGYEAVMQAGSVAYPGHAGPVLCRWLPTLQDVDLEPVVLGVKTMPAVHFWAANLRTQELIDFSMATQARPGIGIVWGRRLPPGLQYVPDGLACRFAEALAGQVLRGEAGTAARVKALIEAGV